MIRSKLLIFRMCCGLIGLNVTHTAHKTRNALHRLVMVKWPKKNINSDGTPSKKIVIKLYGEKQVQPEQ